MSSKLDTWRQLPPHERYPTDISGVAARLAHLTQATGLSNRAISELVKQRLTIFGEHVPSDVDYSLSRQTLNNLGEPGYSGNVRKLRSLERFAGAPEGYFSTPVSAPSPRPQTPRERQIALIAHRLREMDDPAVAAVERIINRLTAAGGAGAASDSRDRDGGGR